ncbi:MAG TPA: hypothetical protein DIT10_09255 [Chryseobacterium sp.]|nr:hypothetical protein [Chryseobacterium sp.]
MNVFLTELYIIKLITMETLANGRFQYVRGAFINRNHSGVQNKSPRSVRSGLPPKDDIWICRAIVIILGLVILMIIIGVFVLSIIKGGIKVEVITICTAISSGAIGTLAGLLAPSPNRQ